MFHPDPVDGREQPRGRNTAANHDLAAAITLSQPPAARGRCGTIPRYCRSSLANRFFEAAASVTTHPDIEPVQRIAYRVGELVRATGVSRKTIERRINDGTLKSTKVFGVRLIEAESVRALFSTGEQRR
jgi:hypothetical protein